MAKTRANPGLFNFQNLMNEFYKYDTKKDPAAAAMKNAFQGNAIQSVFDTQQAKELAYANQEIAANAMNQASNLEQRNMAQVMKDEFVYGMTKMGQEYDFQSRFAVDEANRNLNEIAMQGDTQMNITSNQYGEDRKTQLGEEYLKQGKGTIGAEGAESRLLTEKAATEERTTELGKQYTDQGIGKIGAAGAEQRETLKTMGTEDRQTRKDLDIMDIGSEYTDKGVGRIGATGQENRKTEETKGDQARQLLTLQAKEGREDKRLDARLKAKERADESGYARGLAGKF